MRLLSRLVIAFAVCLLAIALPATPAQADGAYITLYPSSGVPGEEVKVRGYNFTVDAWVDIYYYLNGSGTPVAEVKTDGYGNFPSVTFEVPESYTGEHEVRAYIGTSLKAIEEFIVEPGLTISLEEGPVGTWVTVEGHGFAKDEEHIELWYYPDGNYEVIEDYIPADEYGWWEVRFPIPTSAKGSHKIDASGDESRLYEVEDASFEVTSGITIDKSRGNVGDTLTVTGNGFYAEERDIKILFAGEEVETEIIRADDKGYWQESFKVPEMPKGKYSVTADGERTKQRDIDARTFEIEPGILLSPDQGHVGMNVTVTGHGFAANKNVVIKYDASQKATAITNANGSFPGVSFSVPESPHGAHQVTAEDAAENEATRIFTMESDPPDTPELISPPDGGRVGFIGRVTPTFEWSKVPDDSGVYYRLQIATSENVTATGEFTDPLVSTNASVGTNYTLEETDALPYGTYYWIVQAVDGAENKSNWTAVYSFRAGLLPLWGFIAAIVAIVVLVGAAVYFFVIRRRTYY